jgi:curved DNA-binding protein CbpA
MVRINQAWEILRDPVKRAAVDRARLRTSGATARVHAADARAAAQAASQAARDRSAPTDGAPAAASATPHPGTGAVPPDPQPRPAPGPSPAWGFPGVYDPGPGDFRPRPQFVSTNWTSGRSTSGHQYDPGSMGSPQGEGAAGPPPGNPSGSVLTFGRYAGWSLGEIARTDLEYLEWLDRSPIGRAYQAEIDVILRARGRRVATPTPTGDQRGLFRRR